MLLADALGHDDFTERVKIYATDIDEEALNDARRAVYAPRQVEAVPPDLLERYFHAEGDRFVLSKELRRAVIFGRHDLIQDAPISRMALIVCRNTLMYFNAEIQARILARFHFGLADDGMLLLGKAEMLLTRSELFTPVDLRCRVFRKLPRDYSSDRFARLIPGRRDSRKAMANHSEIFSVAFEAAPLAQIVIDAQGGVAMYNDRARSIFGLLPTDVGRAFHELEMSYRPVELRSLIQDAQRQRRPSSSRKSRWKRPAGSRAWWTCR